MTSYDGVSYTYDTIGNPRYDRIWTNTWEHGRELESQYRIITFTDGKQKDIDISYVYDVNGMRTQKSILSRWFAGTTSAPVEYMVDEQYDYVYNGESLSQLTVTTDTTVGSGSPTTTTENLNFTYDASGTPMTVTHNGTTYYYVTNLQGDVTDILNSAGTAVVSYIYDAWGNIRSTTGTLSATLGKYNPLRYRGYVYDTDTKFYYLQSRYYNPDVGRFINADALVSTGQGILGNNMFAYCANSPIVNKDPNGERIVGVGIQINVGAGEISFGVEIVVYFDPQVCNKNSYRVELYTYTGCDASYLDILQMDGVLNIIQTMTAIELGNMNQDELLWMCKCLMEEKSLSGGVFVINGNDSFISPLSYSGGFETISVTGGIGYYSAGVFYSYSSTCEVYGIKIGTSTPRPIWCLIDVSYGRSDYSKPQTLLVQ